MRDAVLAVLPNVLAIYVHGRFARGEPWSDSDIDLAIPRDAGAPPWNRLEIGADLAARLQREVDLVDLRSASDGLRREDRERGEDRSFPDHSVAL